MKDEWLYLNHHLILLQKYLPSALPDIHQSLHMDPEALFQFLESLFNPLTFKPIFYRPTRTARCVSMPTCRGLSRYGSLSTSFEDTNWVKTEKLTSRTCLPTRSSLYLLTVVDTFVDGSRRSPPPAQLSPSRWLNSCLKLSTSGNYISIIVHRLWEG